MFNYKLKLFNTLQNRFMCEICLEGKTEPKIVHSLVRMNAVYSIRNQMRQLRQYDYSFVDGFI